MKEQTQTETLVDAQTVPFQTAQDLKTAILIVSVLANITVFVLWLTLQLTSRFDSALSAWLLG